MIEVTNISVMNMLSAIRGARNSMNSWNRMDSFEREDGTVVLGENDLSLATRLAVAGTDHRKFLRQILVSMDILAPLYWWKEFDTYKVGTVSNSTSTMHKIHSVPIVLEHFSAEDLDEDATRAFLELVGYIEKIRQRFVESKDKKLWRQIIQLLPSSYNQLRTITLNYEVLMNIYNSRKTHRLTEWHTFCDIIAQMPYTKELFSMEER